MRPDEIIKTLERAGFEARYVGGCVRDTLLNRPIHDWDIASQALPEDVMALVCALRPYRPQARHCDCPSGRRQRRGHDLPARRRISRWPPPRRSALCAQSRGRSGPPRFYDQRHGDGRKRRDHRSVWRTGRFDSPCDPLRRRPGNALPGGCTADAARVPLCRTAWLFTGRTDTGGDPPLRAALRAHFRVSACGRRRKRRFCPIGLNTLGVCWLKDFWKPVCRRKPPIFPGFPPCPKRRRPDGQPQSCAARRSTRRRSACPRSSAAWSSLTAQTWREDRTGAEWKRLIAEHGWETARLQASLQRTDAVRQIETRGDCVTLRQLAVTGADFPTLCGRDVGRMLHLLLVYALEHPEQNTKPQLLAAAPSLWQEENKIQG